MNKNTVLKYLFCKTAWSISPCPFHLYSAYQLQVHGHLLAAIFPQLWLLPAPFVLHRGAKTSFLNHSTFPKTQHFFFFLIDTVGIKRRKKKVNLLHAEQQDFALLIKLKGDTLRDVSIVV